MRSFIYQRPDTVGQAVDLGSVDGARYLAGGTNLVDLMKLGVTEPTGLVDISRLDLADVVSGQDGGLRIGATVRNSDLAADSVVRHSYPVLAQALVSGASGQIRNQATVGGNLLQRTRCSYFQDVTKPCNKRQPGSGCPAREGEHRELAIFGHSEACVATHPSDMAVALVALDARVEVLGREGTRTFPLRDLHRLPDTRPDQDTVLSDGELITAVELDPPALGIRSRYRKARTRASFAFALVSVAVVMEVSGGEVRDCRIAFGGLAHKPWRAVGAEASLRGVPAIRQSFVAAAAAEMAAAEPLRDNGYKRTLASNLLVATLMGLAADDD